MEYHETEEEAAQVATVHPEHEEALVQHAAEDIGESNPHTFLLRGMDKRM